MRDNRLKSELDATLERLEETIACAGITPCIPLAPPNAFAPSLALAPRMQSSPEAGVGRLLHQQHQWLGLDEGAHLRGVFAARNNGTEHRAEHGRRGPPGVEPASVECVHRGKVGGSQGGSIDYWAARAMYQGAVGRETLQRGAGLSTASCLGDGALAEVFDG